MSEIRVRVSSLDFVSCSPQTAEMFLLDKLRRAGIPVKGIFQYEGLEKGIISTWTDMMTGAVTYVWDSEGTWEPSEKLPSVSVDYSLVSPSRRSRGSRVISFVRRLWRNRPSGIGEIRD